jgi:outer membrane protease
MKRLGRAALTAAAFAWGFGSVAFADEAPAAPPSQPSVTFEVGVRLWFSTGTAEYPLKDLGSTVSALHYNDTNAVSPEAFARIDSHSGMFLKALASYGDVVDGELIDEDFPPFVVPYSKTTSDLDGQIDYFAIDIGYNVVENEDMRIGAFVGYSYWHEHYTAFGCEQIGSNPGICGIVPIPSSVAVIDEDDKYNSIRIGLAGDGHLTDNLSWQAEGVYLITDHANLDTHHFTFGDAYANGDGTGYQLEAALLYQFSPRFNLGLGARWWHLDTDLDVAAFGETEEYTVDRTGVFIQGGLKIN